MLQRFLSEKAQKYAPNTVELYYHILRKLFEDAVNEYEYCTHSPTLSPVTTAIFSAAT